MLRPYPGWVLCEKIEGEKVTKGGIALPDNLAEAGLEVLEAGKVIEAGDPVLYGNPAIIQPTSFRVEKGSTIYYARTAGYHHADSEGMKFRIVEYREIRLVEV